MLLMMSFSYYCCCVVVMLFDLVCCRGVNKCSHLVGTSVARLIHECFPPDPNRHSHVMSCMNLFCTYEAERYMLFMDEYDYKAPNSCFALLVEPFR